MAKLTWDNTGERYFEAGIKDVALYLMWSAKYDQSSSKIANSDYFAGVNWNGVTKVGESPEGADANDLWADDIKYASFRSAEEFTGSIEAYQYPEEFAACNGERMLGKIKIAQQARRAFGLAYKTTVGNDVDGFEHGYKLHLVYNATCSPSSRDHETINDSPDAETMSWDFETTPVEVGTINGVEYKKTSHIVIDSRDFTSTADKTTLGKIEDLIYGSANNEPTLPTPRYLYEMIAAEAGTYTVKLDPTGGSFDGATSASDPIVGSYTTGTAVDLDSFYTTITRTGYDFTGWLAADTAGDIAESIPATATGDKMYKAVWTPST